MMYENPPPPSGYEFEDIPPFDLSKTQNVFLHGFISVDYDLIHPHLRGIESGDNSLENGTNEIGQDEKKEVDEIVVQKAKKLYDAANEKTNITTTAKTNKETHEKKRKAHSDIEFFSEVQGKSIDVLQRREHASSGRKRRKLKLNRRCQIKRVLSSVDSDESDLDTGSEFARYESISKTYSRESKTALKDSGRSRLRLRKRSKICKHKKRISFYDDGRYDISDRLNRSISSEEGSLRYRRDISPTLHDRRSRPRLRTPSPEFRIKQEFFSDDDRFPEIDEDRISKWCSPKKEGIKKIKPEPMDSKDNKQFYGLDSFYCSFCKLSLNSELTWRSHLLGQRHAKAIRAQSVHEVARSSLLTTTYTTPVFEEGNRHDKPPPGIKRVELRRSTASIQEVCDDHQHRQLIIGLKYVWEIRGETETAYYCSLCDAPCGASSVMPHVTGFKHRLQCLKEYFPRLYDRYKDAHKKRIETIMADKFSDYKNEIRREKIRVFKDVPIHDFQQSRVIPEQIWDQPGPSWQTSPFSQPKDETVIIKQENGEPVVVPSNQEFLDTRYADFHCTVCDSHMNNIAMWEAHIRGKRHLKNVNKAPQGIAATSKYIEASPGTVSNLIKEIEKVCTPGEIIVGLKYIRENQGKNGNQYNCFPCGGCCSDIDIVDHILSMKHKIKYLEKMNVDGFKNSIMEINSIQVSTYFREQMVDAECRKMMHKYGRGKPKVYYIKRDLKSYGSL